MKAVLYLNNFWQWSGGMAQYVAWIDGQPVVDPDVTGDWDAFMDSSAAFYRKPEAQKAFRAAIQRLIQRRNSVNGKPYRDDPTIMSWQLANEPRPGSDRNSRPYFDAFVKWVDETAGFIKRLAPRQLVSTGSEGWMGTAGDRYLFRLAHESKHVDYLTFHMWAPNWGWFKPKDAAGTYESAWRKMQEYLDWHINTATELCKPIVLEEFGIHRDDGSFEPGATTVYRDRFYQAIFELIERRAGAGDAIAGSNFWAWGGAGRTKNADFMWKPGDRFVGDPPQEPQGLYSVFDTDMSTIRIISAHARQMSTLRAKSAATPRAGK
jgi:mannan endo-1,4-beta-mannosidase